MVLPYTRGQCAMTSHQVSMTSKRMKRVLNSSQEEHGKRRSVSDERSTAIPA